MGVDAFGFVASTAACRCAGEGISRGRVMKKGFQRGGRRGEELGMKGLVAKCPPRGR
jgi:hypothetical protein